MSLTKAFICLAVLCLAHGIHGDQSAARRLMQDIPRFSFAGSGARASSDDAGGRAYSYADAVSEGGTAEAYVQSFVELFKAEIDDMVEYVERIFDAYYNFYTSGNCDELDASFEGLFEVAATAFASARASVISYVSVEGQGEACGFGGARGKIEAEAFYDLMVDIIGRAVLRSFANGLFSTSETSAFVSLMGEAFAAAYVESNASACAGDDSYAYAEQENYAEAVSQAFASLYLDLVARIDCDTGLPTSSATGTATQDSSESTYAESFSAAVGSGEFFADAYGTGNATTVKEDWDPPPTGAYIDRDGFETFRARARFGDK